MGLQDLKVQIILVTTLPSRCNCGHFSPLTRPWVGVGGPCSCQGHAGSLPFRISMAKWSWQAD